MRPAHICTKSDKIIRDMDLLKAISRVYASVAITITTIDDGLASVIEPHAPAPSARLAAIEKLALQEIRHAFPRLKKAVYCKLWKPVCMQLGKCGNAISNSQRTVPEIWVGL